jgi:hypothetical protein
VSGVGTLQIDRVWHLRGSVAVATATRARAHLPARPSPLATYPASLRSYKFTLSRTAAVTITLVPDSGISGLSLDASPAAPTGSTLGSWPSSSRSGSAPAGYWSNNTLPLTLFPGSPFNAGLKAGDSFWFRVASAAQSQQTQPRVATVGYSLVVTYGANETPSNANALGAGVDVPPNNPGGPTLMSTPGGGVFHLFRVFAPVAGNVSLRVAWASSPVCSSNAYWSCPWGYTGSCDWSTPQGSYCYAYYGNSNPPPSNVPCYYSVGTYCNPDTLILYAYTVPPTATGTSASSGVDGRYFALAASGVQGPPSNRFAKVSIPTSSINNAGAGGSYYFIVRTLTAGTMALTAVVDAEGGVPWELTTATPWPVSPTGTPSATPSPSATLTLIPVPVEACAANATVLPQSDLVGALLSVAAVPSGHVCAALCCTTPGCQGYALFRDPLALARAASDPGAGTVVPASCFVYANVTAVAYSSLFESALLGTS